ncbi:hypothetical protein B0H17DRAFT_1177748 [Mycena rosella]|uniref:Importin N-terminal domain-containing protein n=1 Tax=Mycena rosella TaxID=1033263 RepID=A0AAD7GN70_MYCRO|nr:hypothetical protein B0H17DRAFT_1177748 [Mycena rosella]
MNGSTSGSSSSLAPLAAADVAHATTLIQSAYAPTAAASPAELQSLQSALLAMQRTPAAWGLVVPLLAHDDANVQFFGAHTAHAKIARGELAALSSEDQGALRDALVRLAGMPRSRVVRRKLYGALTALALRLVPGRPSGWEGWVQGTVGALAQAGAPSAQIHEFLAGAAEDVGAANLLPQPKIQVTESLRAAAPLVLQSVAAVLADPSNPDPAALPAALACLSAWLPLGLLPAPDVAALLPQLIHLLSASSESQEAASTALQDLLARPPSAWPPSTLLEPLFLWVARTFPAAPESANYEYTGAGPWRRALRTHSKLLVALADAGVEWVAAHLVDAASVSPDGAPRAALAQTFLRVMLALTAVDPGGAALPSPSSTLPSPPNSQEPEADEEDEEDEDAEGGAPLGFWYLLQEALWEVPVANAYSFPSPSAASAHFPGLSNPGSFSGSQYSDAYPTTPPAPPDDFASMSDAEMGRGRGGVGGTPWTPAASASSGFNGNAGASGGGAPGMARGGSFGFPAPSSYSAKDDEDEDDEGERGKEKESPAAAARAAHAQGAYVALVRVLRAKVVYPAGGGGGRGWSKDRLERFAVYRRDVGDTLVNAGFLPAGFLDSLRSAADSSVVRSRFVFRPGSVFTVHHPPSSIPRTCIIALRPPPSVILPRLSPPPSILSPRPPSSPSTLRDLLLIHHPSPVRPYYILRDDLLAFYVADVEARLDARAGAGGGGWEDLEATLHCLRAVHEALDPDAPAPALARVFAPAVWERLPAAHLTGGGAHSNGATSGDGGGGGEGEEGARRVRRTALGLVETYASYFTARAADAVLPPLRYVLGALADADRGVCLQWRWCWVWGRALYPGQRRGAGVRVSCVQGTDGGGESGARRDGDLRRVRRSFESNPGREGLLLDVGCWAARLGLGGDAVRVRDGIRALTFVPLEASVCDAELSGVCSWLLAYVRGFWRMFVASVDDAPVPRTLWGVASTHFISSCLLHPPLPGPPHTNIPRQAALALRSLCDANRRALAGRISAFAEVHAGLGGVPDSEKGKVLQSIASVIQALPPAEAVAPVEALVGPLLEQLGAALGAAGAHPEAARLAAILQLEILAGVARGLTRTSDPLAFDEDESGGAEADAVRAAREDPRTGALRGALFDAIARVAELWSADSEVGQALSELFKAITALPADVTLLSLPAQPLLGVVCRAAARQLTAVWLALAALLIAQLNPPPLILTLKSGPTAEAEAAVNGALGAIVGAALAVLGAPGGMVENPDIVQEFFACMDRVAQDFTNAFCALPDGAFDALMQCAISGLALQERYSLVAACTFLGTLIHRTALYAPLAPALLPQLQAHMIRAHGRAIMRAVLCGFAGAAPRSVTANLLELLGALVSRWDDKAVADAEGPGRGEGGARAWVAGVVFADDFFASRAGHAEKERFVKTVVRSIGWDSSRSVKKTKEAANQFTLVAWGLEGSTFGYSSVSSV